MTRSPASEGIAVMGDEVSGVDADGDAVELGVGFAALALDGGVYEGVDLLVGQAAFDFLGRPPVLGGEELVDRDPTLIAARSSIARRSGIRPSRS